MLFVKILLSALSTASRDRRELAVVKELGADTIALAKAEKEGVSPGIQGVDIRNITTRPLGERMPAILNRVVSLFTWASYARKLHADVISGHDLPGLTVAWISTWFTPRRRRPLLVYDAHEFELGRVERNRLVNAMIGAYERFLMNRCAFSIMVNDGIADETARIHRLKERPVVVRNTPYNWKLDQDVTRSTRAMMCARLGVPDDTFITMYHGMLFPVRGIELMLEATKLVSGTVLVVIGSGDEDYLESLKSMCRELCIEDRVLFLPIVENSELWKYTSAADLGLIALRPLMQNAYFSLPNKLFENIQSMTPVVISNLPEQKKLVEKYDIGLTFKPSDAADLAAKIAQLRDDRELYARFKRKLVKAKEELCWENEKKALADAYRDLFARISDAERMQRCPPT